MLLPCPNLTPAREQLSAGDWKQYSLLARDFGYQKYPIGFVEEKRVKSHITNAVSNKDLFFPI